MVDINRFQQIEKLRMKGWRKDDVTALLQKKEDNVGAPSFMLGPDKLYYAVAGGKETLLDPQPDIDILKAAEAEAELREIVARQIWMRILPPVVGDVTKAKGTALYISVLAEASAIIEVIDAARNTKRNIGADSGSARTG